MTPFFLCVETVPSISLGISVFSLSLKIHTQDLLGGVVSCAIHGGWAACSPDPSTHYPIGSQASLISAEDMGLWPDSPGYSLPEWALPVTILSSGGTVPKGRHETCFCLARGEWWDQDSTGKLRRRRCTPGSPSPPCSPVLGPLCPYCPGKEGKNVPDEGKG